MRILQRRLLRLVSTIFVEKQVHEKENDKENGLEELEYEGGLRSVRKNLVIMKLMRRSLVNKRFVEKEVDKEEISKDEVDEEEIEKEDIEKVE
jgi:hypothetical protein